jgi:(4S)-4-hydroxy-5-phosphonooxypentane-2,3-dione isomerase
MYVVCVTVFVSSGQEQAFIKATRKNHEGTLTEPGALRFDVLQAEDDPCKFFLYEVYKDKAAFGAHKETGHYKTWAQAVAGWMTQPRQAVKYLNHFPADGQDAVWNSRS